MLQVAEMYFLQDLSRAAIGEALDISRFKVARLLKEARESGLVNITLLRPDGLDPERARKLKSVCGLDRALVVPWLPDNELLQILAEATASYFVEHIEPTDIVGLPSGRTASRIARLVKTLPDCTVVQIAGVAAAASMWESPIENVRRLTQLTAGQSFPIFAPIVLNSLQAAESLRQEPGILDAYSYFPKLTKAMVAIAPWRPNESMIHDSVSAADQKFVAECGAAAEVLANILDPNGNLIASEFTDRALTIPMHLLRSVPDVIAVAGGESRHEAVLAAVRANFINTLVTDSRTAQFILDSY
ncbi:sugar-binding transcriptional regulator [Pararhizobium sp. O133]|uniref:sugar-binding transcriptional regulator n=1 Tax=Pararhizobium sp. O133 TaxID=3449278 RepID=UPI003F6846D9